MTETDSYPATVDMGKNPVAHTKPREVLSRFALAGIVNCSVLARRFRGHQAHEAGSVWLGADFSLRLLLLPGHQVDMQVATSSPDVLGTEAYHYIPPPDDQIT
jgi:hypothetical protein